MVSLQTLRRNAVLPVAVTLLSAVGLLVADVLGLVAQPTLLRASFTLLAALLALGIFVASRDRGLSSARHVPPGNATKLVVALSAGAVLVTAALGSRLFPFAIVLPLGFALVAVQLRGDPAVPAVLTQLGALFLAPRLGKYLTTGFYFGGTDTFAHVAAVDLLVEARYTPAIPTGTTSIPSSTSSSAPSPTSRGCRPTTRWCSRVSRCTRCWSRFPISSGPPSSATAVWAC
jgi:hypothetical protein